MKALIDIPKIARGRQHIQMLGIGEDEKAARIAAFAYLNRGRNDFDEEHAGGYLLNVSADLADLYRRAMKWHDVLDQDGNLLAAECPDASIRYRNAMSYLCVTNGELSFERNRYTVAE